MSMQTTERFAAGTCMGCGFVNGATELTSMKCHGCGKRVKLDFVRGSYNGAQPCDGACQYAVGPNCSCSCGGENHRRGYIHVEYVPVWVRERDKQRHQGRQDRAVQRETARRLTKEERAQARREELLVRWPALAALTSDRYDNYDQDVDGFLREMFWAFGRGDMTDNQAAAAVRAIERERRFEEAKADRARVDAARVVAGVRVPAGRVTFTGRIVSVREEQNVHTWHDQTVWKVLVEAADGWRVWGRLPKGLEPPDPSGTAAERDAILTRWRGWHDRLPGREVTIRAQVQPSDKDPLFGFFKRPHLVAAGPQRGEAPAVVAPEPEPVRSPVRVPAPVSAPAVVGSDPWGPLLTGLGV